jgi:hypothetical protein
MAGLTLDELKQKVEDLQKLNEMLGMENEMLADNLNRYTDKDGGLDDADDTADLPSGADKGKKGAQPRKREPRHVRQTLDTKDKFQIAQQEHNDLTKDIEQTKKISEQNMDILKALMEETDIRTAEVKRDAYEFRRDIVVGAENPRTGKTMAEKVLKYMEDKLTQKDMLINKLLMKRQAYKIAIKKNEASYQAKQDSGDDLQYIDFHQLQIENQCFVVKIEDATQELLELKRRSGRTTKMLNNMKSKLSNLAAEAKLLEDEINERKAMLTKTEQDIQKVVEEKESARKEHKKLKVQCRQGPDMPKVVDYVSQKAEYFTLEAEKRNWERKVEIAETAAKRVRAQLRSTIQVSG